MVRNQSKHGQSSWSKWSMQTAITHLGPKKIRGRGQSICGTSRRPKCWKRLQGDRTAGKIQGGIIERQTCTKIRSWTAQGKCNEEQVLERVTYEMCDKWGVWSLIYCLLACYSHIYLKKKKKHWHVQKRCEMYQIRWEEVSTRC